MTTLPLDKTTPPTLPQDVATVATFMAVNGGYVLAYQKSVKRLLAAGKMLSESTNASDRTDIAAEIKAEGVEMKRLKKAMVDVHKNPEDWTAEDLQKLKTDPRSAEMFKALVRVREAMVGNEYSDTIKNYLKIKLQNIMRFREEEGAVSEQEVKVLMDRVKQGSGGKAAQTALEAKTGALFDVHENIKMNLNGKIDDQALLAAIGSKEIKYSSQQDVVEPKFDPKVLAGVQALMDAKPAKQSAAIAA